MHRHHTLFGKQIVEDAEHRLLHFTRICGAADQDQLLAEIDRDHRFAAAAMARWISAEARQVNDGIFGNQIGQFRLVRTHQQRADKQIVPGKLVNHPHIDAIFRLRAAKQIGNIKLLLFGQCGQEIFLQRRKMRRVHRNIGLAPMDGLFGFSIANDIFILRRTTSMLARRNHQRAVFRQHAFAIGKGRFDKMCRAEIPVDAGARFNTLIFKCKFGRYGHVLIPSCCLCIGMPNWYKAP